MDYLITICSSNPFPNKPWFLRVWGTSLENTAGKGEIARNKQFLLFPVFSTHLEKLSAIFIKFKIVVCKLFQFGRVQDLSFWKGLINQYSTYPSINQSIFYRFQSPIFTTYILDWVTMLSQQLFFLCIVPGNDLGVLDASRNTLSHSCFHSSSENIKPAWKQKIHIRFDL